MSVKVKNVTQKDFNTYWTSEVCEKLNEFIWNTKWWATDFDTSYVRKKWIEDEELGITFIGVDISSRIDHPSKLIGQDTAVVAADGSIGLIQHRYDESFNNVFKILLSTGIFAADKERLLDLALKAIRFGGLSLDGALKMQGGLLFAIADKVIIED